MFMDDSILFTIKKMLGLDLDYDAFDVDVLVGINSALMVLSQAGVGEESGFVVTGTDETWSDFLGDSRQDLESAKMYVYLATKLLFDPPSNSSVLTAMTENKKELEWRLNVLADKEG